MSAGDDLVHELSDKLNGILIGVELALHLVKAQDTANIETVLTRARDDCSACAELIAGLRKQLDV